MSIQQTVGADSYEKLRKTLARSFPGTKKVTDAMVDQLVKSMWRNYLPEYAKLGVPAPQPVAFSDDEELQPVMSSPASFPLYMGHGRHKRLLKVGTDTPMASEFVGDLPMVRVALPQRLTGTDADVINTQIGDVYLNGDHLVGSIELVARKYGDAAHLGYRPARVDLITPARLTGTRFGAIAVYLGYRGLADMAPSFYLLEAGTATGEAKVLYFSKSIASAITSASWYKPTPFTSEDTRYHGVLTVDGGDPVKLVVEATQPGRAGPYLQVTVEYEKVATLDSLWPGDLILEAAGRVAAIAEAMNVPSGEPGEPVLAAAGRAAQWVHEPKVG